MQAHYDIIVIGSGLSGSAAANYLAKNNCKVLILEAENYVGGRTKTSEVVWPLNGQKVRYDEGASWFHAYTPDMPLVQLAKSCGVQIAETKYEQAEVYDQKGNSLEGSYDMEGYSEFMDKVSTKGGVTIEDAIKKVDPKKLSDPNFMNFLATEIQGQKAADISNLGGVKKEKPTTEEYYEEDYFEQDYNYQGEYEQEEKQMFITNGYSKIAQNLVNHPNITVMLSKPVVSIKRDPYQNKSGVTTQNGQYFQAEDIVISVPLGVLKSNFIKFEPPLPADKVEAIYGIGFGHLYKVFVLVNKPVPKSTAHIFSVVDKNVNNRGFAPIIYNLDAMAGIPGYVAMLTGNLANGGAYQMQDEEFNYILAKKLSACLHVDIQPHDLTVRRGKWLTNPHFKGTYTYESVKTKKHHFRDIAKPIFDNQWYFCGEHTHYEERSITYGAYSSGINTAKDIMEEIDEQNWKYRKY